MHLDIQYAFNYNDFASNMQRFADLGLEIYITEMDVRVSSNPSAAELQTQADYYRGVIQKCMAQPAVKAIQVWGFTDKYSWVPGTFPGRGAALIFDNNYNAKPSYYAMQSAIGSSPVTVTPTRRQNTPTPTRPGTPTPTQIPGTISIAAGRTSALGSFQADQYYSGGSTYANSNTVDVSQITSNPPPAALFNNERYGAFSYTIPGFTAGSSCEVTLYFAETYLTSSGSRRFNVSINGATVLSNFDIYASAGGQNRAIARSFTATANSSGQIVIQLTSVTENPKITWDLGVIHNYNGPTPTPGEPGGATPTPTRPGTPTPTQIPGTISIAAGSTSAVGGFQADQYYSGGSTYANSNTVDVSQITSNPPPAALFNNERYGAMSYTIPGFTSGNSYTVTLYFAETYLTSSGSRRFNVSINGATVLSNFDIYASAGGQNKAIARPFTATANSSGQIVIQFTSVTENPKINGISIKPGGSTPTPTPTRVVNTPTPTPTGRVNTPTPTRTGTVSISIAAGRTSALGSFQADQYYSGGSTYANSNTVDVSQITSNPPPAALFNNERYGAMSYTIPGFTAGSSYTVTLYFAETYLTSAGSRRFNVSINGSTVLSNFDIFASAGGQNRAIARSFTATANSSGQIVIQFISGTQNPKINGISIR
jgi:hypothetical protein